VVTRSAAFTYRARQTDARTVARELGVDTLLEGTVREGREALRITVHLVRGADAIDVWSESFDLPKGDELGAQDQIGNTIERRVAAYVPGFQPSGDDAQQQAQTLALQANHFAQRSTDENLTRAMELAKEAVKLKPDYAAAYAVLADVQLSIVPFRRSERQQLLSEVRANAGRAMSLNSNLASPLVTLATLALNYEWKWAEAEDLYRRAIALNPNQHASHARYSRLLTLKGRNNEAIQHAKQAEALAPLSIQSLSALGQAFYYARDFDQALVALERGMEIDPGYVNARYTKARIFALRGDRAQALQELDRIGKRTAESVAIRHWILTTQGKHAEAAPLLEEARKASCISYAASLLAIGRPDDAMARLEEAAAAKDPDVLYAAVSPVLESLGGTARLKKLAEKFGL
ncbi:MAG TPA: tetratricopeptide repeat protein, partial [Bryobacteraceae bacterium]|nr:tetratricopeptide repeat protein [Bryobacteraceae bacterium]